MLENIQQDNESPIQLFIDSIRHDLSIDDGILDDVHVLGIMYRYVKVTCHKYILNMELCDECREFMQEKVIETRLDRRLKNDYQS
jgi:hypothetical protein